MIPEVLMDGSGRDSSFVHINDGGGDSNRSCVENRLKCDGLRLLRCHGGSFQFAQECAGLCNVVSGCIDAPVQCRVGDRMDAPIACDEKAPPESFEPDVQWTWTGPGNDRYSVLTPLVANLTDDNGDGAIDLCDTPDVIVVTTRGSIYILDGLMGTEVLQFETHVGAFTTPALGDIDDDGLPEIVAIGDGATLVAFEHDGTLKWRSDQAWNDNYGGSLALADLDNDGDVEILAGNMIFDHRGTTVFSAPENEAGSWSSSTAADLDGDRDLEFILGATAYHHDGSVYYSTVRSGADGIRGYPQVADFDEDGLPEILVTSRSGLALLEHDGTVIYQERQPIDISGPFDRNTWIRPATVHDFDGDGRPEYAMSSGNFYTVYEADATIVWSSMVSDESGIAAGTAFDFLGDGTAEAMYADETRMFVFDSEGTPVFSTSRTSGTLTEYPVVADIDNDGSAEIVIVSSVFQGESSPTVQVIRDREDRWIQARRIWNQHTYHVTNIREDGTIPQFEPSSWRHLNTFRTNAQIQAGVICQPQLI